MDAGEIFTAHHISILEKELFHGKKNLFQENFESKLNRVKNSEKKPQ